MWRRRRGPGPVAAALPPRAPPIHQPVALENIARRRRRRPCQFRLPPAQPRHDLLWTPQRMRLLLGNNPFHHIKRRRPAVKMRRPRQLVKPRGAALPIPRQPLVAGLARNSERRAELHHRVLLRQTGRHKPQPFVHLVSLSPCHALVPPSAERTVTYVNEAFWYLCIRFGQRGEVKPSPEGRGEVRPGQIERKHALNRQTCAIGAA